MPRGGSHCPMKGKAQRRRFKNAIRSCFLVQCLQKKSTVLFRICCCNISSVPYRPQCDRSIPAHRWLHRYGCPFPWPVRHRRCSLLPDPPAAPPRRHNRLHRGKAAAATVPGLRRCTPLQGGVRNSGRSRAAGCPALLPPGHFPDVRC